NRLIRSQVLYPVELRVHFLLAYQRIEFISLLVANITEILGSFPVIMGLNFHPFNPRGNEKISSDSNPA
ncbi:MAG: hypothetical protein WD098_03320, partial [Balneolales bacterium]